MQATITTRSFRDRWKGWTIGAALLGVLLLGAMAIYRDIDVDVYSSLPDVFLSMMGIPEGADVGVLSYAAVYGTYGAMTLAGLAIATGSASIAGEERNGTIGLLFANPTSRTQVLVAKAAALVLLAGLGAVILHGAGLFAPALLDVSTSGTYLGALMFHMFVNALFYGFMAMAVGAWTGKGPIASGVSAGVMIISFIAAGLLAAPALAQFNGLVRVMPWNFYNGSDPINNGVDWGDMAVLIAGIALFVVIGVIGINRRDFRGRTTGVTLLDRLRSHPLTATVAERLAGSSRVSQIWIKTASEHQGLLLITSAVMFLLMGVIMGPLYSLMDADLLSMADGLPEVFLALFGGGNMSTPEGFYQLETFGMMAPAAIMTATITIGAGALAGEEARGTMGLLLANPVRRSTVLLQKTVAMVLYGATVGFATFAGVAAGSLLGGLGMSISNIAATSLLATLLGLVIGGLALAIGAATGRLSAAIAGAAGAAILFHLLNAFLPLSDRFAGYAKWSPFYYYLTSDPLVNGMHWGHAAVLAGLTIGLVALSVLLFERRDLRKNG